MSDHAGDPPPGEVLPTSQDAKPEGVDTYLKARDIVRLTQCTRCSRPLRLPMRLPCGNTACRSCLPPAHTRSNITYPLTEGRDKGFYCPFPEDASLELATLACGAEHALGDCGIDVTLSNATELIENGIHKFGDSSGAEKQEIRMFRNGRPDEVESHDFDATPLPLHGSPLSATYKLAQNGELPYTTDIAYNIKGEGQESLMASRDRKIFDFIKDTLKGELNCQVCYSLILDPCTTACGHTFCRSCVERVLDHSNLCPICRRKMPMVTRLPFEPKNTHIERIISQFFPSSHAARLEAARRDGELGSPTRAEVPLFVCTLSFPSMRTFLHIFEPRYRLMIRRTLQSGERKFGMVPSNRSGSPQGELGSSQFTQYGTMLEIDRFEMLPDGRSLISTTGLYKFKVLHSSIVDGYNVGKVERVDDISIGDEENAEVRETTSAHSPVREGHEQFNHLTTRQLFEKAQEFVKQRQAEEAPWLHDRVLAAYGSPPEDAAVFPYWLASVLPISEEERYTLLPAVSVRQRLKITAKWVQKLEDNEWYVVPVLILHTLIYLHVYGLLSSFN